MGPPRRGRKSGKVRTFYEVAAADHKHLFLGFRKENSLLAGEVLPCAKKKLIADG
jgi:hypothetical protein